VQHTTIDLTADHLTVKTTKKGDRTGSVAITIVLPAGSALALHTA
jgi:hypothetical protein